MPKQSPSVPKDLEAVQEWFAAIITRPIDDHSRMNPISPSGCSMTEEASKYIVPSPTLQPHERIELYNQQYWWRLLSTMQEIFPLVTRLFGYHGFNQQIAVPYLVKYPPNHWSLVQLGENLTKWILEEYHDSDKKLVYDAASLDWAFNAAFIVQEMEPLNLKNLPESGNTDTLLKTPLYLQPHIHLFSWDYDLFPFRHAFLDKDPDYWVENDFPELPKGKPFFFLLYRNRFNDISWKEISAAEYHLLALFQQGSTIEAVCQSLENHGDESIREEAEKSLHFWFQEWAANEWLSSKRGL